MMFRNSSRLFSTARRAVQNKKSFTPAKLAAAGTLVAVGGYLVSQYKQNLSLVDSFTPLSNLLNTASCASAPEPQPSVFSGTKQHALYLTVHLKPTANVKAVLAALGQLQKLVDDITPPADRDEDDEILAGVGFGPNLMARARPHQSTKQNYSYVHRKGELGAMPATGGDFFIHAKCNEKGKLFELCGALLKILPADSVDSFEDIYGWVYRNGRDLSGFIDGTENAADDEGRFNIAVEKETGGSYVITQKWHHNLPLINNTKDSVMEGWMGRSRADSTEQRRKSLSSHVARMTGGGNFEQKKAFEIVRQSQPFGTHSGDKGLFFIGYSKTPDALNFMLDRMVGADVDGLSDGVMNLTTCVAGTYWYFPGKQELANIVAGKK